MSDDCKSPYVVGNIGQFTAGAVVVAESIEGDFLDIGHVESFGINPVNEVIVFIKSATRSGELRPFHPVFLKVMK